MMEGGVSRLLASGREYQGPHDRTRRLHRSSRTADAATRRVDVAGGDSRVLAPHSYPWPAALVLDIASVERLGRHAARATVAAGAARRGATDPHDDRDA